MIGFFGDSFLDLNPDSTHNKDMGILPWPIWVSEKLGNESIVRARSGSAIWYAYERFTEYFHSCDTIVFGYTDYRRTNGLDEYHAGLGIVCNYNDPFITKEDREIADAVVEFKKYLYNEELQKFIFKKVFEEVNNLCFEHGKKLVNILSFEKIDNCIVDLTKAKYPCLLNLFDASARETLTVETQVPDIRHCHLSPENNIVMSEIVIEAIKSNSVYIKDLTNDNRFIYV